MRRRRNSHKLQQEKVQFNMRKKNDLQGKVIGWSLMGVRGGSTLGYIQNTTGQASGSDTEVDSALNGRLDSMIFKGTFQPKYFFKYFSKWFLSKLFTLSKSLS